MKYLVLLMAILLVGCSDHETNNYDTYFLSSSTCEFPPTSFNSSLGKIEAGKDTQFKMAQKYKGRDCGFDTEGFIYFVGSEIRIEIKSQSSRSCGIVPLEDYYRYNINGKDLELESNRCKLVFTKQ